MGNEPVKVDRERFDRALKNLVANLPVDAKGIMQNEARAFVQALIAQAKPNKGNLELIIDKTLDSRFKRARTWHMGTRMFKYRGKIVGGDLQWLIAFKKMQKSHVGWFASGFIGSGNPLNVSAPGWVRKHKGEGKTTIVSGAFGRWGVTVVNASAFAAHVKDLTPRMISLINSMLSKRSKNMEGNLRRILKGKAEYRIKQ